MENALKRKRIERGMTQSELSKEAGVSRTVISKMENGKVEITTTGTLMKLAKALNASIIELFFDI